MSKTHTCSLLLIHFLLLFNTQAETNSAAIAIVRDGPSWYFDPFDQAWQRELNELSEGMRLQYKQLSGDYDPTRVRLLLLEALADPKVDVVYAAGIIATELASQLTEAERSKPVMGGALQFSDSRAQPISTSGTSTLKNYTFITEPQRVASDLELLLELAQTNRIVAILDETIMEIFRDLDKAVAKMEATLGIETTLIKAKTTAKSVLDNFPPGIRAAYVALLPRMPETERQALYEGLAARGVLTVSMLGRPEVELGALAGLRPKQEQAAARRTALNLIQLLSGIDTDALPVYLPVADHLILNAGTARQTPGWSPSYDTALAAEIIHEDELETGKTLNLEEALALALRRNSAAAAAREDAEQAATDARTAHSPLRPQLDLAGQHGYERTVDPVIPQATAERAHMGAYGFDLKQVLYDESLRARLAAGKLTAESAWLDARSTELDAIQSTAEAYFNLLEANALYEIERDNQRLTDNNLQLARLRRDIGAADPSEVFRWEQNQATGRAALFSRDAARN